jgi:hypothetical protein
MQRSVHPLAVLTALAAALLLSGTAGYMVRGALPQAPAAASQAVDSVPAWAFQGTGPTDADLDPTRLSSMCAVVCTGEELAAVAGRSDGDGQPGYDPPILVYG